MSKAKKEKNAMRKLPFNPADIVAIRNGSKTAFHSPKDLPTGYYLIDGSPLVIYVRTKLKVENIDKFPGLERWIQEEGYANLKELRQNAVEDYTKEFLEGKRPIYIYTFKFLGFANVDHLLQKFDKYSYVADLREITFIESIKKFYRNKHYITPRQMSAVSSIATACEMVGNVEAVQKKFDTL